MKGEKETITHESYGMMSITRTHSNAHNRFFGSNLAVNDYFTLKIVQGETNIDLNSETFSPAHPRRNFIEVHFSANQLTELITNMNSIGVPCTIAEFDGKDVPQVINPENRKEFTQRKFKESLKDLGKSLVENDSQIDAILKKDKLSKEDKEAIKRISQYMVREVTSNIPYVAECFQETMDKIVVEAKTTIDAALQHQINTLGIQALQTEHQKVLNSQNNDAIQE